MPVADRDLAALWATGLRQASPARTRRPADRERVTSDVSKSSGGVKPKPFNATPGSAFCQRPGFTVAPQPTTTGAVEPERHVESSQCHPNVGPRTSPSRTALSNSSSSERKHKWTESSGQLKQPPRVVSPANRRPAWKPGSATPNVLDRVHSPQRPRRNFTSDRRDVSPSNQAPLSQRRAKKWAEYGDSSYDLHRRSPRALARVRRAVGGDSPPFCCGAVNESPISPKQWRMQLPSKDRSSPGNSRDRTPSPKPNFLGKVIRTGRHGEGVEQSLDSWEAEKERAERQAPSSRRHTTISVTPTAIQTSTSPPKQEEQAKQASRQDSANLPRAEKMNNTPTAAPPSATTQNAVSSLRRALERVAKSGAGSGGSPSLRRLLTLLSAKASEKASNKIPRFDESSINSSSDTSLIDRKRSHRAETQDRTIEANRQRDRVLSPGANATIHSNTLFNDEQRPLSPLLSADTGALSAQRPLPMAVVEEAGQVADVADVIDAEMQGQVELLQRFGLGTRGKLGTATTGVQCGIITSNALPRNDAPKAAETVAQWVECPCCFAVWNQSARTAVPSSKQATTTVGTTTTRSLSTETRNSASCTKIASVDTITDENGGSTTAVVPEENTLRGQQNLNTDAGADKVEEGRGRGGEAKGVADGLSTNGVRDMLPKGQTKLQRFPSLAGAVAAHDMTTPSSSCLLDVSQPSADSSVLPDVDTGKERGVETDSGYFGDGEVSGVEGTRPKKKETASDSTADIVAAISALKLRDVKGQSTLGRKGVTRLMARNRPDEGRKAATTAGPDGDVQGSGAVEVGKDAAGCVATYSHLETCMDGKEAVVAHKDVEEGVEVSQEVEVYAALSRGSIEYPPSMALSRRYSSIKGERNRCKSANSSDMFLPEEGSWVEHSRVAAEQREGRMGLSSSMSSGTQRQNSSVDQGEELNVEEGEDVAATRELSYADESKAVDTSSADLCNTGVLSASSLDMSRSNGNCYNSSTVAEGSKRASLGAPPFSAYRDCDTFNSLNEHTRALNDALERVISSCDGIHTWRSEPLGAGAASERVSTTVDIRKSATGKLISSHEDSECEMVGSAKHSPSDGGGACNGEETSQKRDNAERPLAGKLNEHDNGYRSDKMAGAKSLENNEKAQMAGCVEGYESDANACCGLSSSKGSANDAEIMLAATAVELNHIRQMWMSGNTSSVQSGVTDYQSLPETRGSSSSAEGARERWEGGCPAIDNRKTYSSAESNMQDDPQHSIKATAVDCMDAEDCCDAKGFKDIPFHSDDPLYRHTSTDGDTTNIASVEASPYQVHAEPSSNVPTLHLSNYGESTAHNCSQRARKPEAAIVTCSSSHGDSSACLSATSQLSSTGSLDGHCDSASEAGTGAVATSRSLGALPASSADSPALPSSSLDFEICPELPPADTVLPYLRSASLCCGSDDGHHNGAQTFSPPSPSRALSEGCTPATSTTGLSRLMTPLDLNASNSQAEVSTRKQWHVMESEGHDVSRADSTECRSSLDTAAAVDEPSCGSSKACSTPAKGVNSGVDVTKSGSPAAIPFGNNVAKEREQSGATPTRQPSPARRLVMMLCGKSAVCNSRTSTATEP